MVKSTATAAAVTRGGTKTTAEGQEHSTGSVSSQEQDEVIIDPDEEIEIDETAMNYDFAMKEVILNELNSGKLPLATSLTHFYCNTVQIQTVCTSK